MAKIQHVVSILLLLVLALSKATGKQISCERKEGNEGEMKTCRMDKTTSINSDDATVEKDFTIIELYFRGNLKIKLLPVEVKSSFPELSEYDAGSCGIATIREANFKGLTKLTSLFLDRNQIQSIPSDTFVDLESLRLLDLRLNSIEFMDGLVFLPLLEITLVDLRDNKCVDELFASSDGTTLTTTVAIAADINCTLNSSEAVDEPVTDKTRSSEVVDEPVTDKTGSSEVVDEPVTDKTRSSVDMSFDDLMEMFGKGMKN